MGKKTYFDCQNIGNYHASLKRTWRCGGGLDLPGRGMTKPKRDYYHVTDGEWIEVTKRGQREQCCDCGLIHRLNFRINDKGRIEVQAFRDARATNGARKNFKYTKDDE